MQVKVTYFKGSFQEKEGKKKKKDKNGKNAEKRIKGE